MSSKGTMFHVASWPAPWPPPATVPIFVTPAGSHTVQVLARRNGAITVHVLDAEGIAMQAGTTPPLRVNVHGMAAYVVMWNGTTLSFSVNGRELLAIDDKQTPVEIVLNEIREQCHVLDDPDLMNSCACWIRERSKRYANQQELPIQYELDRLRESVLALHEDAQRIRLGFRHRCEAAPN